MWLAWVLLVGVAAASAVWWFGAEQTALRNRWLDGMAGARQGTLGVGISLLVVDPRSEEEYADLLGCTYPLFEVVVLLNGAQQSELLRRLVARYHLLRVEYHPSGEFPIAGVWGLYRSRKRRFRRLVVVDVRSLNRRHRLYAAADVAALEFLLPLGRGESLQRHTIERMATELSLHPLLAIDQLCYTPLMRPVLWRRVALVAGRGFDLRPWCVAERRRRVGVWIYPLKRQKGRRKGFVCSLLLLLGWWLPPLVWGLQGEAWRALLWGSLGSLAALSLLRIRQLDRLADQE